MSFLLEVSNTFCINVVVFFDIAFQEVPQLVLSQVAWLHGIPRLVS
jgi:hypothetical protein